MLWFLASASLGPLRGVMRVLPAAGDVLVSDAGLGDLGDVGGWAGLALEGGSGCWELAGPSLQDQNKVTGGGPMTDEASQGQCEILLRSLCGADCRKTRDRGRTAAGGKHFGCLTESSGRRSQGEALDDLSTETACTPARPTAREACLWLGLASSQGPAGLSCPMAVPDLAGARTLGKHAEGEVLTRDRGPSPPLSSELQVQKW